MRIGKLGSIMPTQSLVFLALGAAAILAFIFLIILPGQRLAADLDREIAGLTTRIEEQRVLTPIFTTLFAKSKAPPHWGCRRRPGPSWRAPRSAPP
jgi:hypothetical protein